MKTFKQLKESIFVKLTDAGYLGLGIYLGFKSSHRRSEMERYELDYEDVVSELTKNGLIKDGKINTPKATEAFKSKFGDIRPSQIHQYKSKLNLK